MKRLSSNRKTTQKPRQTEGTLVSLLPPHRKKEFRIFLGLTGYFHIWIPHRGLTTNLFMRFSRDPKMNPRNGTPLCGWPSPYSRQPSPPLWPPLGPSIHVPRPSRGPLHAGPPPVRTFISYSSRVSMVSQRRSCFRSTSSLKDCRGAGAGRQEMDACSRPPCLPHPHTQRPPVKRKGLGQGQT